MSPINSEPYLSEPVVGAILQASLQARIGLANEQLQPTYTLKHDPVSGVVCHDSEGMYLFTLPEWAVSEDVETAVQVTRAMADAYAEGWEDGNWAGQAAGMEAASGS